MTDQQNLQNNISIKMNFSVINFVLSSTRAQVYDGIKHILILGANLKCRNIGHYINGVNVAGQSDRTSDVFNPATGEVQAKVSLATVDEMNQRCCNCCESTTCMGNNKPTTAS